VLADFHYAGVFPNFLFSFYQFVFHHITVVSDVVMGLLEVLLVLPLALISLVAAQTISKSLPYPFEHIDRRTSGGARSCMPSSCLPLSMSGAGKNAFYYDLQTICFKQKKMETS